MTVKGLKTNIGKTQTLFGCDKKGRMEEFKAYGSPVCVRMGLVIIEFFFAYLDRNGFVSSAAV